MEDVDLVIDGRKFIPVTEHSDVLQMILACYSPANFDLGMTLSWTPVLLVATFKAANKYDGGKDINFDFTRFIMPQLK